MCLAIFARQSMTIDLASKYRKPKNGDNCQRSQQCALLTGPPRIVHGNSSTKQNNWWCTWRFEQACARWCMLPENIRSSNMARSAKIFKSCVVQHWYWTKYSLARWRAMADLVKTRRKPSNFQIPNHNESYHNQGPYQGWKQWRSHDMNAAGSQKTLCIYRLRQIDDSN